jgi:flagellar biosynthesis protein FlhB
MSEPSPERLRRARARGDVPVSHRLSVSASLAAALALVGVTARILRAVFDAALQRAVTQASAPEPVPPDGAVSAALVGALRASAPLLGATAAALLFAHLAQTRLLVAWRTRAAGRSEAALTALWGVAVAGTGAWAAWALLHGGARDFAANLARVAEGTAWRVVLVAAGLGAAELAWRRAAFLRAMTPTRAEQERERREHEGDPRARAERRAAAGGHGA